MDKSVQRVIVAVEALPSDRRDRFVHPYLVLMIDSFSCNYNFTLNYAAHSRQPFCFEVIF